MSRNSNHISSSGSELLEIISKEQKAATDSISTSQEYKVEIEEPKYRKRVIICPCRGILEKEHIEKFENEKQKLLKIQEDEAKELQNKLDNEIQYLKDRFDFILRNEQIRSSCMLREAHRERQEKILALRTQMECKNISALMYVMCSERRKSKLKILKLKEDYNKYIEGLLHILNESQNLILNLSRGYKTAARVDDEWRTKMKKIIGEFQNFIFSFAGGSAEVNQYFLDLPNLLKIKTSTKDNPKEDPCDVESEESEENESLTEFKERHWWDDLETECRPFIVFGDLAEFKPPQRREVLKAVKAAKTAPKKWKEYAFNNMYMREQCENADTIKDVLSAYVPPMKWEFDSRQDSKQESNSSRRVTTTSVDVRGAMGSTIGIITSAATSQPRTAILAARDSMEIASATRLREKHRHSHNSNRTILNIGNKSKSVFLENDVEENEEVAVELEIKQTTKMAVSDELEDPQQSASILGSIHRDSLEVIPMHVPEQDHRVNYEKVCPIEHCARMTVDEFTKSLPPYMRASPFEHFEKSYEEYEPCTPEQLEILQQRLDEKKRMEKVDFYEIQDNPLAEWTPSKEAVETHKTEDTLSEEPPCTCRTPSPSLVSSVGNVYKLADLIPVKHKIDQINAECFYNDDIEFNRFRVIGQDEEERPPQYNVIENERLREIKKVLKQHPSLCEIFEGAVPC